MAWIIATLVFLTVFTFALSLFFLVEDLRASNREKLMQRVAPEYPSPKRRVPTGGGRLSRRLLSDWVDIGKLEYLLQAAQAPLSVDQLVAASLVCGLMAALTPLLLSLHPMFALLALGAGLSFPYGVLRFLRARREEALVKQLPEAVDTIVRSLRAGHSVDASIQEVARGLPPPIGEEFKAISDEMAMGLPFEKVLENLQRRFPGLPDIRILCATFAIQRETGGNLTEVLAGLSHTIRERFRLKRQVAASTAEARISALILGLAPVGFAAVTWVRRPDYMGVFLEHPLGNKLLLAVIVMEIAAFLLMRFLSRVEV